MSLCVWTDTSQELQSNTVVLILLETQITQKSHIYICIQRLFLYPSEHLLKKYSFSFGGPQNVWKYYLKIKWLQKSKNNISNACSLQQ